MGDQLCRKCLNQLVSLGGKAKLSGHALKDAIESPKNYYILLHGW